MPMTEFWKLVVEVFKQFMNENVPKNEENIFECKF